MVLSKSKNILIIVASAIVVALVVYISKKQRNLFTKSTKILLLGGLDNRVGDKNITEQAKLLQNGTDNTMEVFGFRFNNPKGIIEAIEKDPNNFVVLFSAGCRNASNVAESVKSKKGNLNNIYIVEPFNGTATIKSVKKAVEIGVPSKNVIVGSYAQVGKGMINGSTLTPKCSPSHWCSLTEVGKIIKK